MTNYLLSYPRSGNSWLRYCLEVLTEKRTIGYLGSGGRDLGILPKYRNNEEILLIKRHAVGDIENNPSNKLILILRNYNDVLIRHGGISNNIIKDDTPGLLGIGYIKLLKYYDIFLGDKMVLYYEDLIDDIMAEINKCNDFLNLNISQIKMDDFSKNIKRHKKESIKLYGASRSNGNKNVKYSSILSQEEKEKYKNYLIDNHGQLYEKYLKKY